MTNEEKQRKIAEENKKLNNIREQANLYAGECPEFSQAWMKKRLESYAIKHDYNLPPANDIKNAMDWLHGLQESDPKLAGKIDRISWEAGQQHQQKWHDDLAKKAEKLSKFEGNPDDITPMIKYEDGFQWVKLETAEAKDFEGNAMGNCVGKGGYDNKTIFSLRDKNNFPHITVEYDENSKTIEQMKCKGNSEVTDDYMPVVENLISELKPEHIRDIGDYVISTNGNYYIGMDRINQASQEGIKFDKIKIQGEYALSTDGKVYLGEDAIKNIPEGIVLKDVNIAYCKNITEFNHKVLGDFDARCSGLTKIGPDADFGGSVDIESCENITEFNNKVLGDFDAYSSGLTTIGPDAEFGGSVDIRFCEITEFNNKVLGDFDAEDSSLTNIGPDAEFGRNVDISGTPLSKEIGMYVIKTSEKKQAFADAIKSMDSKQEHTPEQIPEPEEEYSMSM